MLGLIWFQIVCKGDIQFPTSSEGSRVTSSPSSLGCANYLCNLFVPSSAPTKHHHAIYGSKLFDIQTVLVFLKFKKKIIIKKSEIKKSIQNYLAVKKLKD